MEAIRQPLEDGRVVVTRVAATAPSKDAKLRAWLKPKNDDELRETLYAMAYLIDPTIGSSEWGEDPAFTAQDALIEYGVERYEVRADSF